VVCGDRDCSRYPRSLSIGGINKGVRDVYTMQ
jgi:hypothetical protein